MFSRALLCAGVLAFGVPAAGQAQGVAQLQAVRARLQREADSLRAVRRAGPSMDAVQLAGGWTLVVSPAVRALSEREVPLALAAAGRAFGGVVKPTDGPVRVRFDTVPDSVLVVSFSGVGAGPTAWAVARRLNGAAVRTLVTEAAREVAWQHADPSLRRWAGGLALQAPYAAIAPAARIRLARDTGMDVTGCRHGDVAACERALAASGVSEVVRTSLFRSVLERAGGTSRLADLYADPSRPVLDRLATLAGEPRDLMVSEWRERLIGLGTLTTQAALASMIGALVLTGLGIWGMQWRRV